MTHEKRPIEVLVDQLRHQLAQGKSLEVRETINKYEELYKDPKFHDFIRSLYQEYPAGSPGCGKRAGYALTVGPHKYACVIFEAPESQQNTERRPDKEAVDSILVWPLADSETGLIELDSYRRLMMDLSIAEKNPYGGKDGPKFALTTLEIGETIRLRCHKSRYYKVLSTSEYLKLEALQAWAEKRQDMEGPIASGRAIEYLPYRKELHDSVGNPILFGRRRGAGLATSTLICYRMEDGGYRCILFKRSEEGLSEAEGWFHVVPAAQFEPDEVETNIGPSYSIKDNILREYAEELFRWQPPNRLVPRPHRFSKYVEALETMFSRREASLHVTGISLELATLRADICTLLLISTPEWEKTWLPLFETTWEHEGTAKHIDLGDSDETIYNNAESKIGVDNLYVQGAGAFWLGVRVARDIIPTERNEGPKIPTIVEQSQAQMVWVEWWDPPSEEERNPRQRMEWRSAKEQFDETRHTFFFDERLPSLIKIHKERKLLGEVFWSELDPAERKLLKLVLESLRENPPMLTYQQIAEAEWGTQKVDESVKAQIRSLKSRLHGSLFGLLGSFETKKGVISPKTLFSYCWIRSTPERTVLG